MSYGIVVLVSLFLTAVRAEDTHIRTSATRALLTVLRRGDFRRFLYASGVHRRLFSFEERPQDIERVPQGQEERPHPRWRQAACVNRWRVRVFPFQTESLEHPYLHPAPAPPPAYAPPTI